MILTWIQAEKWEQLLLQISSSVGTLCVYERIKNVWAWLWVGKWAWPGGMWLDITPYIHSIFLSWDITCNPCQYNTVLIQSLMHLWKHESGLSNHKEWIITFKPWLLPRIQGWVGYMAWYTMWIINHFHNFYSLQFRDADNRVIFLNTYSSSARVIICEVHMWSKYCYIYCEVCDSICSLKL